MKFLKKVQKSLEKRGIKGVTVSEKNGCVRLTGTLSSYEEIVKCGRLAVQKGSRGVLNDLTLKGFSPPPPRLPDIVDQKYDGMRPDVCVIGGGIVGSAIARELSKYNLKTVVLEKEYDVATGQSSRNDGMIHAGIDLSPFCNKVKYNVRGNRLYNRLSEELDVPINKCGQLVFFTEKKQKFLYPVIKLWGSINKIPVRLAKKEEIDALIPGAGMKFGGIMCPSAGIVSPYLMTVALAESSVKNGVEFCFNTAVLSMELRDGKINAVRTNRGTIYPKVVINAAGVFSDVIAEMAGDRHFTIHPRKGIEAIFDSKTAREAHTVAGRFILGSKKGHTKGGGVVPTIDGNILMGPDAEETPYREDETTNKEALEAIYQKQREVVPNLKRSDIITYFAGTRAATYEEQFIVEKSPATTNFVQAAGIQSPGVTAAPAIAEDVARFTKEILSLEKPVEPNAEFESKRKGIPRIKELPLAEREKLIKENPDYGVIICRCEQISKGEILDAIRSPIPATTLDGIKRRVRPGMGRCQGGFCAPLVTRLIAAETGADLLSVQKKGIGSQTLLAPTKGGEDV